MKISRRLEMTILLLNRGSVTARELAERFEVSTRTIYRDVEALAQAGVPVYAARGTGGGIFLMEEYTLNKALLTDADRERILFGLRSLQAVRYPEIDALLDKLGNALRQDGADWIELDMSPWGCDPNYRNRMTDIRRGILERHPLEIEYRDARNQHSRRTIEPIRLLYKGNAWYVWGWCRARQDYRLFRLSRIREVRLLAETFIPDPNRPPVPAPDPEPAPLLELELRFQPDQLTRLYDEYDEACLKPNPDGTYSLTVTLPEGEWVYGYILGFGPGVEVISPPRVRQLIRQRVEDMRAIYKEEGTI